MEKICGQLKTHARFSHTIKFIQLNKISKMKKISNLTHIAKFVNNLTTDESIIHQITLIYIIIVISTIKKDSIKL